MKNPKLGRVLKSFVERDGRLAGELARASANRFKDGVSKGDGKGGGGVPHRTIHNWLGGKSKKPRDWQGLVKLAIVLDLSEREADELLIAARHYPVATLRERAGDDEDRKLLAHWEPSVRLKPFQALPDLPYFAGRVGEVSVLKEAIVQQGGVFCFQGMGGVGKTTLAVHLAYQLRAYFPDGVLWAQLDGGDTMSLLALFAGAYGHDVSQYGDLRSRGSKVRGLLADKRALIILDDAQRDEDVRPLLPPTASCSVIITTRRHDLSVADDGERFDIKPFSEQKEALALFTKILGDQQTKKERQALIEIADLLGHLPLAVAIAANRMKHEAHWSAARFLERVRQQKRRLKELKRGDQGVRLSFDLSYHALSPHLQRLFATLGAFEEPDFTVEGAAYLAQLPLEDAEDHLRNLCRLSLLQQEPNQRYKLHPLLRDYSREQQAVSRGNPLRLPS